MIKSLNYFLLGSKRKERFKVNPKRGYKGFKIKRD